MTLFVCLCVCVWIGPQVQQDAAFAIAVGNSDGPLPQRSSPPLISHIFLLSWFARVLLGVLRLQHRGRVLWETTLPSAAHALCAAPLGSDGRHVLVAASYEGQLCFVDQQRAVVTANLVSPITCLAATASCAAVADRGALALVAVGRLGGGVSVYAVPRLPFETPAVAVDDGPPGFVFLCFEYVYVCVCLRWGA